MTAGELLPVLGELAGADALREVALDRELALELERRGISLTDADIERERERLAAALGTDEIGDELARQILATRLLGPHRLGTLLRRNASLRALIDRPEPPSEAAVRVAYEVRHGPKRRVRIAVLSSSREAAAARRAIAERAEQVGLIAAFAEVAAERSIDRSAGVGGLIGEISTADPGLPAALRREVAATGPNRMSDLVALDQGFALILIERDIPADGTPMEAVADSLRGEIVERSARLAMEDLAERLIERARVTPLEPSLRWSWDRSGVSADPTSR